MRIDALVATLIDVGIYPVTRDNAALALLSRGVSPAIIATHIDAVFLQLTTILPPYRTPATIKN